MKYYLGKPVYTLPTCVFRKKIVHYGSVDLSDPGARSYHYTKTTDVEEWRECIADECPYFDPKTAWCKRLGFDRPKEIEPEDRAYFEQDGVVINGN